MKTIEERAKEYADKESGNIFLTSTDKLYYKMLYEDYIKIATEQKKVDIEKAIKYLRGVTGWDFQTNTPCEIFDEGGIEEFRKALEEE